jgi:L-asparagine transporter-like permease
VQLLKRFAVTILGAGLLAVGVALMVLPGPGILLIVAGLAVLATEYVWARKLLGRAKDRAEEAQRAAVASPLRTAGSFVFAAGMVVVGVLMLIIDDLAWPVLDSTLDSFWSPITGSIIIVTGLILATTTVLTLRMERGEQTTYTS